MSYEALTAIGAFLGAVGTLIGLPLSYVLTNRRISKHRARDEYLGSTDAKIRDLLTELVLLKSEVSAWATDTSDKTTREVQRAGALLNSRLNFELNEASKADIGGGKAWLSVVTDDFEAALMELHEDRRRLGGKTLGNELSRLTSALADTNRLQRPDN